MWNYFNELGWKIKSSSVYTPVTIEFRFQKSLAEERFKSNLELGYQIIVSSMKVS